MRRILSVVGVKKKGWGDGEGETEAMMRSG